MRICSLGRQICSHMATLKYKKRAEVIYLTPVMQAEFQSLHSYQLKPHRGGRKSNRILSGEVLNSAGKHKMDCLFFNIIICISLFYFPLTFSTLQPHHPSLSVFLPTCQYSFKSDATAISSFGGLCAVWENN